MELFFDRIAESPRPRVLWSEMSDDELLAAARKGGDDAFATLCERHRRRVWRTVSAIARRPVDAEDLTQETFVKAYQSLRAFRGDAPFGAYLTRIAVNVAHDHAKSAWKRKVGFWKTAEQPEEADTASLPTDEAAAREEVRRRVRKAVAELDARERVPIHLLYFEEYSLVEIARLEGVPESTIRSRIKAGLKRLEPRLGDLMPAADSL